MTKEEIKQKEDRLGEMFLVYFRMMKKMDEDFKEFEKIKGDLSALAGEIEQDYLDITKEQEDGEKLC